MRSVADIVIRRPNGELAAVIELKNLRHLTPEAATWARRNLLERGGPRTAPYFLVLSGETGCLWRDGGSDGDDRGPELCFPVGEALRRIFPGVPMPPVSEGQLSLMVFQWLAELIYLSEEPAEEPEKSLAATGFIRAIQGGTLVREETA